VYPRPARASNAAGDDAPPLQYGVRKPVVNDP